MDETQVAKRPSVPVVALVTAVVLWVAKTVNNLVWPTHHISINPWGAFFLIVAFGFGISGGGFAHLGARYRWLVRRIGGGEGMPLAERGATVIAVIMATVLYLFLALRANAIHERQLITWSWTTVAFLIGLWIYCAKIRNPNRVDAKITMKDGQPVVGPSGLLDITLSTAERREIAAYNAHILGTKDGVNA